jgi:putative membrane protein insertion efficiency factor
MSDPATQAVFGDATPPSRSRRMYATGASRLHEIRGPAPGLLAYLPARALLGLLWLYRRTFSPVLPLVLGPGCGCRFHPTCAVFAAEAVRQHGALRGSWLAVRRLLKCHPLHPGGFDPVPPSKRRTPTCRAVLQTSSSEGGSSLLQSPGKRHLICGHERQPLGRLGALSPSNGRVDLESASARPFDKLRAPSKVEGLALAATSKPRFLPVRGKTRFADGAA